VDDLFPLSISWDDGFALPTVVIPSFVLLFVVYHFIVHSVVYRRLFSGWQNARRADVSRLLVQRALFILLIGVVPLVLSITVFEVSLDWLRPSHLFRLRSIVWTLSLSAGLVGMSVFMRKRAATHRNYPQIRTPHWTHGTHAVNIASWAGYLFAYEFGYRGYLLFVIATALGSWPAIAVSVALYSALHIPRGPIEAVGCIPLGIAFSLAALHTGTIWVPFLAHYISAIVNDLFAFHYNPEFRMRPIPRTAAQA
jgi:membrane protease YdiL (CAAX protease family)